MQFHKSNEMKMGANTQINIEKAKKICLNILKTLKKNFDPLQFLGFVSTFINVLRWLQFIPRKAILEYFVIKHNNLSSKIPLKILTSVLIEPNVEDLISRLITLYSIKLTVQRLEISFSSLDKLMVPFISQLIALFVKFRLKPDETFYSKGLEYSMAGLYGFLFQRVIEKFDMNSMYTFEPSGESYGFKGSGYRFPQQSQPEKKFSIFQKVIMMISFAILFHSLGGDQLLRNDLVDKYLVSRLFGVRTTSKAAAVLSGFLYGQYVY